MLYSFKWHHIKFTNNNDTRNCVIANELISSGGRFIRLFCFPSEKKKQKKKNVSYKRIEFASSKSIGFY